MSLLKTVKRDVFVSADGHGHRRRPNTGNIYISVSVSVCIPGTAGNAMLSCVEIQASVRIRSGQG